MTIIGATYVGRLQENAYEVAWRVLRLLPEISVVVWLNEHEEVYAAKCGDMVKVPPESIIGIYMPSHSPAAIQADLDIMKNGGRERSKADSSYGA